MTQQIETDVHPDTLVGRADKLVSQALSLYKRPDAYARLARYSVEQASIDWGTVWGSKEAPAAGTLRARKTPFPVLLREIEQLARQIEAIPVQMAGIASSTASSEAEG